MSLVAGGQIGNQKQEVQGKAKKIPSLGRSASIDIHGLL